MHKHDISDDQTIFACLTYRNLKHLPTRIQLTSQEPTNRLKRRDRDLLVLVIAEVFVYIITTSPMMIVNSERMITQFVLESKSVLLVQAEFFVFSMLFLMIFMLSAAPFHIHFISSTAVRRDCIEAILEIYEKIRNKVTYRHSPVKINLTTTLPSTPA